MNGWIETAAWAVPIGIGATATMDIGGAALQRLRGIPAPNYGLVGRWIGYMPRGRFVHRPIAASSPVAGERVIGWGAHYAIGIAFAVGLLAICGLEWAARPTFGPALAMGIATVAAPFLLMQPGMGAGIASRRTPNPRAARLRSIFNHALFGVGLYASAWAVRAVVA